MVNINWFSSFWAENAKRKPTAIAGLGFVETPAPENSRYEFMFNSLMDVPNERLDKGRHRQ